MAGPVRASDAEHVRRFGGGERSVRAFEMDPSGKFENILEVEGSGLFEDVLRWNMLESSRTFGR